jgi:small-conductance mechanosensitive channel
MIAAAGRPGDDMDDLQQVWDFLGDAARAIGAEFTSIWLPIQLGLILLAIIISAGLGALVRRRIDFVSLAMGWPPILRRGLRKIAHNFGTIIFLLLMLSMRAAMLASTLPPRSYLLAVAAKLATAWVVISLFAGLIRNQFVYRVVAISAWTIAALSILDLLEPVSSTLDSMAIVLGGLRITPLLVLKTSVLLLVTLWAAVAASDFFDKRVQSATDLTPSIQVLIGKLIRLFLIAISVMIVLSSVGIDLSALALFSGAVGVGLGFGLQKIVSNLVSGIILLADKSIKPGDVITIGDSFGWVVTMGARYTSVSTRDGREVLIPNEDLVTQRVVNWSYSKNDIRLEVKFAADPASDPHQVSKVALEVVSALKRVLPKPPPVCHFLNLDSKLMEFSLRFWINDPIDGVTNIRGQVMLGLWDAFQREGINFPSPVADMRLRGITRVVLEPDGKQSVAAQPPRISD